MQMKTMLIVIKGHLLLHVSPFSLSLRLSLSSSLYLSLLVSVFLVLPLPVNLPNPLHSVTLSRLSQAAEQLIAL